MRQRRLTKLVLIVPALWLTLFLCTLSLNLVVGSFQATPTPKMAATATNERQATATSSPTLSPPPDTPDRPEAEEPAPPTDTPRPPAPVPPTATLSPRAPTATPLSVSPVVNSDANLRAGPGTEFAIVAEASQGSGVDAVAQDGTGEWLEVALAGGGTAWIAAFLVDNAPSDLPLASATPAVSPTREAPPGTAGGEIVILKVYNSGKVEHVEIANQGDSAVALGGWHVYGSKDDQAQIDDYWFPEGFTLGPAQSVRLHSGQGGTHDPPQDIYWTEKNVWNNESETVYVADTTGTVVASLKYP